MTIKCGVCDKQIPSHMVERRRGSHYSEHYEDVEEILHEDLGKVMHIRGTENFLQVLEELQKKKEPEIIERIIFGLNNVDRNLLNINSVNSIKELKTLIGNLNGVLNMAEKEKVSVNSVGQLGRHKNWRWGIRLFIPDINICKDCFSKFNHPAVTLGYLDRNVPSLNLREINKDIWDDVKGCMVEIELESD